jgi:hypothetical protein
MAKPTALPDTLSPRLINRDAAADYVGVGVTKFDEMVADGRMPRPKRIDHRKLWCVRALDTAADALPDEQPNKPLREIVL